VLANPPDGSVWAETSGEWKFTLRFPAEFQRTLDEVAASAPLIADRLRRLRLDTEVIEALGKHAAEGVHGLRMREASWERTRSELDALAREAERVESQIAARQMPLPRRSEHGKRRPFAECMDRGTAAVLMAKAPGLRLRAAITRENLWERLQNPKTSDPLYPLRRGGPHNRDGVLDGVKVREIIGSNIAARAAEGADARAALQRAAKPLNP
jgi:hypothetical protein